MTVTAVSVVDAPSDIIGMSIVQAESRDEALGFVREHHHLGWAEGCEITLLEEVPVPEEQLAH